MEYFGHYLTNKAATEMREREQSRFAAREYLDVNFHALRQICVGWKRLATATTF